MPAGRHDITVEQGADFYMLLTLKDSDGEPIDLTGHSFRGKIRATPSESAVIAEFDFTLLDQSDDETIGQVEVEIPAVETAAIVADASEDFERTLTYFAYDIESDSGGAVTRWLEGTVTLSPECTK